MNAPAYITHIAAAALIAGLLLLFAGCEKEKTKDNTSAQISITEVLLPNCVYDIIEKEKLVVINSQKEYDSLFTGCSGEKPNIDFQKQNHD